IAATQQKAQADAQQLAADTAAVGRLPLSPDARAAYTKFAAAASSYIQTLQKLMALPRTTASIPAQKPLITTMDADEATIEQQLVLATTAATAAARAQVADASSEYRSARTRTLPINALGHAASVVLATPVAHGVTEPLPRTRA